MVNLQTPRRGRPPIQDGQDVVNSQQVSGGVTQRHNLPDSLLLNQANEGALAPEEAATDASCTELVPCPEKKRHKNPKGSALTSLAVL